MKTILAAIASIAMVLCMTSFSMAAGWNTCKGCHNGKMAPSQETLVKKFKTEKGLIAGAKAAKSPMMKNFKKDDLLKAAAKDLGLK